MNTAQTTAAIKSFPVAAGAYRNSDPRNFLTHACETSQAKDADGSALFFPTAVLCKRVKFESILEDASLAEDASATTCPACLAKLAKLAK